MSEPTFDVVVPTTGRPSLSRLLDALARAAGPRPGRVLVVHDGRQTPEDVPEWAELLAGPGRGPAAARNAGWRASHADWVAFLDDDVVPEPDWLERLAEDLRAAPPDVAASQGRVTVPLPQGRRPTDSERNVKGLETARFVTADMAFRRTALAAVGGFDERFARAYREDADLALRVVAAGYGIVRGERGVLHPAGPARPLDAVRRQAGNADDVLMAALHGRGWHERAGAPRGRRRFHLAVTAAGLVAVTAIAAGRRGTAAAAAIGWLAGTAELAWRRIAPGPRTYAEVRAMVLTSALIPPTATFHWLAGHARRRRLLADRARAPRPELPQAVLLDRDGTLVVDVPYNGEPDRVVPLPEAREALDRLRAAGIALGVISNQSGVARGLIAPEQVEAVNRRIDELVGPIGSWAVCPHLPDAGCGCRKPAPGLVVRAAELLGADPARCVVIGDIGADVDAARAAGARAILVPNAATRPDEIQAAPQVAASLGQAVDLVLGDGA